MLNGHAMQAGAGRWTRVIPCNVFAEEIPFLCQRRAFSFQSVVEPIEYGYTTSFIYRRELIDSNYAASIIKNCDHRLEPPSPSSEQKQILFDFFRFRKNVKMFYFQRLSLMQNILYSK